MKISPLYFLIFQPQYCFIAWHYINNSVGRSTDVLYKFDKFFKPKLFMVKSRNKSSTLFLTDCFGTISVLLSFFAGSAEDLE
jgi:ACT domain-containing protein